MGPNLTLGIEPAGKVGHFGFGKNPKRKVWVEAKAYTGYRESIAVFSLTRQCESLSDLISEVERLKRELDDAVEEARSSSVA